MMKESSAAPAYQRARLDSIAEQNVKGQATTRAGQGALCVKKDAPEEVEETMNRRAPLCMLA